MMEGAGLEGKIVVNQDETPDWLVVLRLVEGNKGLQSTKGFYVDFCLKKDPKEEPGREEGVTPS